MAYKMLHGDGIKNVFYTRHAFHAHKCFMTVMLFFYHFFLLKLMTLNHNIVMIFLIMSLNAKRTTTTVCNFESFPTTVLKLFFFKCNYHHANCEVAH